MKVEHFPWESVQGQIFHAREEKPRKKWVTAGGWILSVVLILSGFAMHFLLLVIFGILYALALMMKVDKVVTKRGVEIFNQMMITSHHEIWEWADMNYVLTEDRSKPGLTAILFNRGDRVKRLYFDSADAPKILEFAKEMKPGILTGDADDYSDTNVKSKAKKKAKN